MSTLARLWLALGLLAVTACGGSTSPDRCDGAASPIAVAGPDHEVALGSTVELAGGTFGTTGSASYLWRLESIPPQSQAEMSLASAAGATFVADRAGTYVVSLTVRDACGTSQPDVVSITVPGPRCPNPAPVAVAGSDLTLTYRTTVYLNGEGSLGSAPLGYRWWIESAPATSLATLQSPGTATPSLSPDRSGTYVVALVVNDGCQDSAPDLVTIVLPNSTPVAYTYSLSDQPILVPLTLSASGWDADYDPLTYAWTLVSKPVGSTASLPSPTLVNPPFTPDLPGTYAFSVVVSDGQASSAPATLSFRALDYPPLARAGADAAGTLGVPVTLDGSASADPNQTPLAFAWTLAAPGGSTATLSGADTARPTFVPDVSGTYRATLVVTSGGLSASDSVDLAVWPAVQRLSHRVIDAAYSAALDRIVTVAADPSALYLLDPATGREDAVSLSLVPAALSLSPDGLGAAVGHAGAITMVDLAHATAGTVVPVSGEVAALALGSGQAAWVIPRPVNPSDKVRILAEPLAGGTEAWVASGVVGPARLKLRPGADALYLAGGGYPGGLEHYAVSGATTPVLLDATPISYNSGCGDLWFSQAGSRLFTRCGAVYLASSAWTEDLTVAGSLIHLNPYSYGSLYIRHLSDSTAAGQLSALTSVDGSYSSAADDQVLRRWSAADLAPLEVLPLPTEAVAGTSYRWNGRFVFYRSDGSERYLILQLDPAAGALDGFGWVTF